MSDLDLDAIEARASAATKGPWTCDEMRRWPGRWNVWGVRPDENIGDGDVIAAEAASEANAEFIAHARADVPALVAEVKRLRGDLRGAHVALDEMHREADAERDALAARLAEVEKERDLERGYSDCDTQTAAAMATRAFTAEARLAAVRELVERERRERGGKATPWTFVAELEAVLAAAEQPEPTPEQP